MAQVEPIRNRKSVRINRFETFLPEQSQRAAVSCGEPLKTVYFGHFSLQFAGDTEISGKLVSFEGD